MNPSGGFAQGFDEYQALWPKTNPARRYAEKYRAAEVNQRAVAWLFKRSKGPRKPFFLYLHYIEPHAPYSPPPALVQRLAGGGPVPGVDAATGYMMTGNLVASTPEELRVVGTVYDAEVLSLDEQIGKLFVTLLARGLFDQAVVVVTSDHGEELRDHGRMGHGATLYNELIHVPLIVAVPGRSRPRSVEETVSLVDVAPTLLDLAGIPCPASFEGRSLRPLLAEPARPWRAALERLWWRTGTAFSELIVPATNPNRRAELHERAAIRNGQKLIVQLGGGAERFDLERDPGEQARTDESRSDALRPDLTRFTTRVKSPAASTEAPPLDEESRERLKALGYLN